MASNSTDSLLHCCKIQPLQQFRTGRMVGLFCVLVILCTALIIISTMGTTIALPIASTPVVPSALGRPERTALEDSPPERFSSKWWLSWLPSNLARSESASSKDYYKTTAQRFTQIAGLYQQKRVNCAALYADKREDVDRAVAVAKLLAAEEERQKGGGKDKLQKKAAANQLAVSMKDEVSQWYGEFESLSNKWYLNNTQDCKRFKQMRGYITSPLTQEEAEFPIAYSILVFKDIEMVERVFRSVYRPQNQYCFHVDSKAKPEFYKAVEALAGCFSENVDMSHRRVDVRWGTYTVLEPELICMKDLWGAEEITPTPGEDRQKAEARRRKNEHKKKWKYFINLTGQEFPLKTNHELVKIMKAYKGANNEEGTRKRANKDRWKTKAPLGIQPTKGGVHTLLNRATVDFILHDPAAKQFIDWVKHTGVPDETFFATINYNPQLGIPGTYNGTNMEKVPYLIRYKNWYGHNCYSGQTVRGICIFSTGDLKRLGETKRLFANKFYLHEDRIAVGCLEEKIFNDTRDEFLGTKVFNTTFYEKQDFVLNRVRG